MPIDDEEVAVDSRVPFNKVATTAVSSFGKRGTPKLLFSPMKLIDDSLEHTVQYMNAAVRFVSNLVTTATKSNLSICPFQLDMSLASGQPTLVENEVDDDPDGNESGDEDDDDDDDFDFEEDQMFFDVVGDIKGKLEHNKLRYIHKSKVAEREKARMLEGLYKGFLKQHRLKETRGDKDQESFLHRRRMVAFVDRRKGKAAVGDDEKSEVKGDDVWLFEPPSDCSEIPDNPVPEWFINASRTTLLPHLEYRVQSELSQEERDELATAKKTTELEEKAMATKQNVCSSFHCFGSVLTLSLYVKSQDVVKCYLYWHGRVIRFFPEDIRTTMTKIFDLKKHGNEAFLKSEKLDGHIDSMKRGLRDEEFKGFQVSYR